MSFFDDREDDRFGITRAAFRAAGKKQKKMKLVLCPKCSDLFRLTHEFRKCECGKSGGNYVDNLNAVTYGEAIPVGFANGSFVDAIRNQPEDGMGKEFTAFIIPKKCPSIVHHKKMKR